MTPCCLFDPHCSLFLAQLTYRADRDEAMKNFTPVADTVSNVQAAQQQRMASNIGYQSAPQQVERPPPQQRKCVCAYACVCMCECERYHPHNQSGFHTGLFGGGETFPGGGLKSQCPPPPPPLPLYETMHSERVCICNQEVRPPSPPPHMHPAGSSQVPVTSHCASHLSLMTPPQQLLVMCCFPFQYGPHLVLKT